MHRGRLVIERAHINTSYIRILLHQISFEIDCFHLVRTRIYEYASTPIIDLPRFPFIRVSKLVNIHRSCLFVGIVVLQYGD